MYHCKIHFISQINESTYPYFDNSRGDLLQFDGICQQNIGTDACSDIGALIKADMIYLI